MPNPVFVRIKNFQSIEDLDFEINGFTAITGRTNIGKSAIIRAISSALLNKSVVGLIRRGSKFCTVDVYSNTWGFRWEKGNGVGRYTWLDSNGIPLIGPDGKPKMIDKIGQGQVSNIADMGFGSIEIGSEVLQPWFATQFDPIFLLNKTGPAITDFFSEVAHLKVLQNGVIISVRGRKRALDNANLQEIKIKDLQKNESYFTNLDSILQLVSDLKQQADSIRQYETKIELRTGLYNAIKRLNEKIVVIDNHVSIPADIDPQVFTKLSRMNEHWINLEIVAIKARSIRGIVTCTVPEPPVKEKDNLSLLKKYQDLPAIEHKINMVSGVNHVDIKSMEHLGDHISRIKKFTSLHISIDSIVRAIKTFTSNIKFPIFDVNFDGISIAHSLNDSISFIRYNIMNLEKQYKILNEELLNVQKELDKIPSCKLCGRPLISCKAVENNAACG